MSMYMDRMSIGVTVAIKHSTCAMVVFSNTSQTPYVLLCGKEGRDGFPSINGTDCFDTADKALTTTNLTHKERNVVQYLSNRLIRSFQNYNLGFAWFKPETLAPRFHHGPNVIYRKDDSSDLCYLDAPSTFNFSSSLKDKFYIKKVNFAGGLDILHFTAIPLQGNSQADPVSIKGMSPARLVTTSGGWYDYKKGPPTTSLSHDKMTLDEVLEKLYDVTRGRSGEDAEELLKRYRKMVGDNTGRRRPGFMS